MGRAHKFDKLIAEKCVEDASKYIYYIFRRGVFRLVNRKVSNWIVFREKSDSFLKCLWFSCDLWGFWRVERGSMLDGVQKCVLKMLQNIFDCV